MQYERTANTLLSCRAGRADLGSAEPAYEAVMVDQEFCFNAGEWNFPDAPLRGLYARNRVYQEVIGRESFEPWLERIEKRMDDRVIDGCIRGKAKHYDKKLLCEGV